MHFQNRDSADSFKKLLEAGADCGGLGLGDLDAGEDAAVEGERIQLGVVDVEL